MTTLAKIFNFLGLSPKARKMYELMLERGPMPASVLAQELNIPRSTIYLELSNLQKLNLISMTGSQRKRCFVVENPNVLLQTLDKKSEEIKELIPDVQKIVMEQRGKIQKSRWGVPQINFFRGIEGVKKILNSTNYVPSREILGIVSTYDLYEMLGEKYLKNLIKERVKKNVRVKNIWPKGEIPKFMQAHKEQLRDVRFSKEHISLHSTFLTFDNKVIIITSAKELFSIEITSHDLAQAIKILFQILWERAGNKS